MYIYYNNYLLQCSIPVLFILLEAVSFIMVEGRGKEFLLVSSM